MDYRSLLQRRLDIRDGCRVDLRVFHREPPVNLKRFAEGWLCVVKPPHFFIYEAELVHGISDIFIKSLRISRRQTTVDRERLDILTLRIIETTLCKMIFGKFNQYPRHELVKLIRIYRCQTATDSKSRLKFYSRILKLNPVTVQLTEIAKNHCHAFIKLIGINLCQTARESWYSCSAFANRFMP